MSCRLGLGEEVVEAAKRVEATHETLDGLEEVVRHGKGFTEFNVVTKFGRRGASLSGEQWKKKKRRKEERKKERSKMKKKYERRKMKSNRKKKKRQKKRKLKKKKG